MRLRGSQSTCRRQRRTQSLRMARLVLKFEADALDASLPASPASDLIQAVRPGDGPAVLVVDLGPRFGSFRGGRARSRSASRALAFLVTAYPDAIKEGVRIWPR
jgi:hypothetical protein